MSVRVPVRPELLVWARERSGLEREDLEERFPKLPEWERGDRHPTLKQLEKFARTTHTPVGFLFLAEPPDERIPIPDYRTIGDREIDRPSPDLLDTIFLCQQRQAWYRSFALANREDRLAFVGSFTTNVPITEAASTLREALRFEVGQRGPSWSEALRRLNEHAEDLGVLVMISGVVGNNTRRKLNPREFRGFALVDEVAPLVFVNGADTKAAQIFTLAHELAHLWLGVSALSDADVGAMPASDLERWCNLIAAEFLAPQQLIDAEFQPNRERAEELERLARHFRVSTLVVLRRLYDGRHLGQAEYYDAYEMEVARLLEILGETDAGGGGGDFFNTQPVRVSRRFARAIVVSTIEGQTLHRDAFRMLGVRKLSTFEELAHRLGVG